MRAPSKRAGALICFGAVLLFVACGSDDEPPAVMPAPDSGAVEDARTNDQATTPVSDGAPRDASEGDVLVDPPPSWCGPDENKPPPIGGTEACPDDKNIPGCGCANDGVQAACWTGYRRNRFLGACHDGKTKCVAKGDGTYVWGPCEDQRLPDPNATGEAACTCFSVGEWKIANTAPCVWTNDGTTFYAYSTVTNEGGAGVSNCDQTNHVSPGQLPAKPWSKSSLRSDCAGVFKLCYRIKVGDPNDPKADDCTLGESCVDVDYPVANQPKPLADLPAWFSTDSACAKKWNDRPAPKGYYEMAVAGRTYTCDAVGTDGATDAGTATYVFRRGSY